MLKICKKCLSLFNNQALENCPIVHCKGGMLVEVDDNLVDIVKKFWQLGFSTLDFNCGHFFHDRFDLNISFTDTDEKSLERLRYRISECNKEYSFFINPVEKHGQDGFKFSITSGDTLLNYEIEKYFAKIIT